MTYSCLPYIKGLTPKLIQIFEGENIKFAQRLTGQSKTLYTRIKPALEKTQKINVEALKYFTMVLINTHQAAPSRIFTTLF